MLSLYKLYNYYKIFPDNELSIKTNSNINLFRINLQLFAAEDEGRTEQPSERRRKEEREKGNLAKSQELPAAIILLVGVLLIYFFGSYFFSKSFYILSKYFHDVRNIRQFNSESLTALFKNAFWDFSTILFPLLAMTVVAGIVGNILQVGFMFTPRALNFNFSRVRPNFKKVLPNRQTLFNLVKSVIKVFLIGLITYLVVRNDFFKILLSGEMGLKQAMALILYSSFKIFLIVGILLLVVSIVDYLFQKFEFEESLKMTPAEAKQEAKEQEGDRNILSRRRQLSREIMNKRTMLKKVPEADVIITNPTHYAVALAYDLNKNNAPVVIAKGVDEFALYIIRVAKEHNVPTIENRLQARMIYDEVPVGEEIPEKFYKAVSLILSNISSFKQKIGA